MIKTINTLFVTMFGLGKVPKIPGTFGSLATVIILYLFFHIFNLSSNLILIFLIIIFILSFLAVTHHIKDNENRDSLFRTRPGSIIRKGDWKLHYYFEDKGIELYDLKNDVGEKKDLSKFETEKASELMGDLRSWWEKTNAPIPTELNPDFEL